VVVNESVTVGVSLLLLMMLCPRKPSARSLGTATAGTDVAGKALGALAGHAERHIRRT
jgi:hypothetical protein